MTTSMYIHNVELLNSRPIRTFVMMRLFLTWAAAFVRGNFSQDALCIFVAIGSSVVDYWTREVERPLPNDLFPSGYFVPASLPVELSKALNPSCLDIQENLFGVPSHERRRGPYDMAPSIALQVPGGRVSVWSFRRPWAIGRMWLCFETTPSRFPFIKKLERQLGNMEGSFFIKAILFNG